MKTQHSETNLHFIVILWTSLKKFGLIKNKLVALVMIIAMLVAI